MEKRTVLLGDYDTAHGLWTLTGCDFPEPAPVENLVPIPGRISGPLDLSTVLTDGEPTYGSRPLSITLESSEGDRQARAARISDMVRLLHGRRVDIVLPDHPHHYATGRLSVKTLYNDMAHASVQVSGTCGPWLYARNEVVEQLTAYPEEAGWILHNGGAMPLVPLVEVKAPEGVTVNLVYGPHSWGLGTGTYKLPDLVLVPGDNIITYSGDGTLTITYREAVLK